MSLTGNWVEDRFSTADDSDDEDFLIEKPTNWKTTYSASQAVQWNPAKDGLKTNLQDISANERFTTTAKAVYDNHEESFKMSKTGNRKTAFEMLSEEEKEKKLEEYRSKWTKSNPKTKKRMTQTENKVHMVDHSDEDAKVELSLEKLRVQLRSRHADTISNLGRLFRVMDDNNNKTLDAYEFRKGLNDQGLHLEEKDVFQLMRRFDINQDGMIDFDEFLVTLRGELSERRRRMVHKAFNIMDKTGDGQITIDDVRGTYDVSFHPKYQSGECTEEEVLATFLANFDSKAGERKDGVIDLDEWEKYYEGVSASCDTDDYFVLMMCQAWKMEEFDEDEIAEFEAQEQED
eukprot:TRINITY_DN5138_c0_g1_i1.p1 TRINITY_DN5138_c0_g1~~TRINITY_DN5138_c0_g1_i1.p1  ORF type:complete len:353 (+),score=145.35 TRINITY_DN5138_c0_g1_i1:22-1059(+)